MTKFGILHGHRESFPQAVLEALNSHRRGCCRYLCVDALTLEDLEGCGWDVDVVLDFVSQDLPFFRECLYLLERSTRIKVINSPSLLRVHNRATVRQLAKTLGFSTPRSLLLPSKTPPKGLTEISFLNLRYPLDWKRALEGSGSFPYLRALNFDGEQGAVVQDLGNLWRRYDHSDETLLELVESPASDEIYRVFVIGETQFVRSLEPLTHQLLPHRSLKPSLVRELQDAAQALLAHIPVSLGSVDLALNQNLIEYVDFDPSPALEWWHLGEYHFTRAVHGATELLKRLEAPKEDSQKWPSKQRKKPK